MFSYYAGKDNQYTDWSTKQIEVKLFSDIDPEERKEFLTDLISTQHTYQKLNVVLASNAKFSETSIEAIRKLEWDVTLSLCTINKIANNPQKIRLIDSYFCLNKTGSVSDNVELEKKVHAIFGEELIKTHLSLIKNLDELNGSKARGEKLDQIKACLVDLENAKRLGCVIS